MVRVPKAAGAVIDPGIRKTDPVIARQIAHPIGAPNGLPSGLLPVLQTGAETGRLIALWRGPRIAEVTATQTDPKNATWTVQTIVIVVWIEGLIGLLSVVPMVRIGP